MSASAPVSPEFSRGMGDRKSASHGEAGYKRRPHDAYFTEQWVTRALLAAYDFHLPIVGACHDTIWEPACGDGRMASVIAEAGYRVVASDIADWGYGATGWDFLAAPPLGLPVPDCAAIITNPPFATATRHFIQRALDLTKLRGGKVAMLQRHEFDAPATNHPLFQAPFAAKLVLPRRPRWSDEPETASPRFPYAWYLWDWRHSGPPILRYLPYPRSTKPANLFGAEAAE